MIRPFLVFIAGLLLFNCGNTDQQISRKHAAIQRAQGVTDVPFKVRQVEVPAALNQADRLSQVFGVTHAIKLTQSDEIGLITDIEHINGHWFLLDKPNKQIHLYDGDGIYLGPTGQRGQGPGEYEAPNAMEAWGNRLVVFDAGRGQYLVFDHVGTFQFAIDGRDAGLITSAFIPDENQFFFLHFVASSQQTPNHAFARIQEQSLDTPVGFGARYSKAVLHRKMKPNQLNYMGLRSFGLVSDRIWIGSPYETMIRVFDREGRSVAKLDPGVSGFSHEDFDKVQNRSDWDKLRTEKFAHSGIRVLDQWVVVYFSKFRHSVASLYDHEGNLIKTGLKVDSMFFSQGAHACNGQLVFPVRLSNYASTDVEKLLPPSDFRRLLEGGFEPDGSDESLFLVLSQPR